MKDIWFISDTHFGHYNIIKYCDRPFDTADQMDEFMVEQWNSTVKPGDHVYHLGDVMMGDRRAGARNLMRLHGKLRLIVGNHDDLKDPLLMNRFEKVMLWRNWKEIGVTFGHIPLDEEQLPYGIQAHGHIHNKLKDGPYINLCVEHTNYKPVHFDEIAKRAEQLRKKYPRRDQRRKEQP